MTPSNKLIVAALLAASFLADSSAFSGEQRSAQTDVTSVAHEQAAGAEVDPTSAKLSLQPDQNGAAIAGTWGDQGDGTFVNPVMPGDFSDLDAIRVGSDFYAFSSTMQYSPGVLILHSTDLVNWTILSHVVPDLTVLDADLNWNKMARAGRGIWAGALRYHRGKFWVYFGTPDQGIYVSSAEHAEGPWSSATLMLNSPGWDDPCPFWDDDGQGYLVATHFAPEGPTRTPYNIHLFKMSPDSDNLLGGFDQIIHQSRGSEANKLYKINGTYYHFYNEVKSEGRVPMIERSRSLLGPWEIHQLAHVQPAIDKEPNQGGLVELLSGKWYFVTHQGRGDWEGRAGVILPVTWIDGWPILGKVGKDGLGNMVWKDTKPIQGFPKTNLFVSDHFDTGSLNPAWEWRYQPRQDGWSLGARQGYLRLFGFPSLRRDDFSSIPDVLTQRSFRTKLSQVTVRLDLGGMTNGQEAGLAHFANAYCTLSVVETNGFRRLSYNSNGTRTMGPRLRGHILYLRSIWDYAGESQFSYSTNGRDYRQFGAPYRLTWGAYRGDRVGLFTVGSLEVGYIDVDWFHYEVQR